MKVLIITYYWPPSGGSGVQRWLKFVKYLPSFGITPYIFTPENPSFDLRDESLLKDIPPEAEVIHFPIWEPFGGISKVQGGASKPKGFIKKITAWLRGNLIYPDPRLFWVRPSVQFLHDFLRDNAIEIIITTGPPHSVHLIGLKLKKKKPEIKWVTDFRDPWSEWGVLQSFNLTTIARSIHKKMERNVLTSADRVITITPFYVRQLERLSGRKVDLITNGFDETDFENFKPEQTKKFIVRHVGLVNPTCDPKPFMKAVEELMNVKALTDWELVFTGQVNEDFKSFVSKSPALSSITTFQHNVPHSELVKLYSQSSVLLLVLTGYKDGEGFLPGKLFEYLATGLPILAVGPLLSDAHSVLIEQQAGVYVESMDGKAIKDSLMSMYQAWKEGASAKVRAGGSVYSRKQLTFKLSQLLTSL